MYSQTVRLTKGDVKKPTRSQSTTALGPAAARPSCSVVSDEAPLKSRRARRSLSHVTKSEGVARRQPRHLSMISDFGRLSHAVLTIQKHWRLRQRRATRAAKTRLIYSVARNSRQKCSSLDDTTGCWTKNDLQMGLEKEKTRRVLQDVSKAAHLVVPADRFIGHIQQQAAKHRMLRERARKQLPKLKSISAMHSILGCNRAAQDDWMLLLDSIRTPCASQR